MYLAMKEGTKNSITQAILEEFLVHFVFHKTKFLTVDMKVVAYSAFSKLKN
jgi:hypothetical protein